MSHVAIPEAISERGRGGFPKENWGAVTWKEELDAVWAKTTDICVSVDTDVSVSKLQEKSLQVKNHGLGAHL